MIFFRFRFPRGETLTETLISLFIISFAIVTAITLLVTSIQTNQASKERIIAINLAREGLEAIRTIRDTNWLRFSAERRLCWNTNPSLGDCTDDNSDDINDTAILPGFYRVDFDPVSYEWNLSHNPDASDSANNHLFLENGLYTHRNQDLGGGLNQTTDFSRRIQISYLQDDGTVGDVSDNRWEVISDVTFAEGSRLNHVTLVTHLSDYLGRIPSDF